MGFLELDLNFSEETKAMQETARKFGMEVVRPAGIELDRMHDPADVIAEGSILWDVFKKFREQGFHKMMILKAFGGMMDDMPPMSLHLISEQLGYADAGLAVSLLVSSMPFAMAVMSPDAEVRDWARQYAEDTEAKMIGCWGITEPDHGSDWVIGTTPAGANPKMAPSLRAVKKGDEYILNGQKSAWVSNGSIATHTVLHICLDPSKGTHGQIVAFCPLNLPGISRGKPLNKLGQRALNQGEIFFDDVKLHKKYLFIPSPGIFAGDILARRFLGFANGETAVIMSGLAQAAYDEAINYAKERVQGGVPITEHENIKLALFNMFTKVEEARAYVRYVQKYNESKMPMGSDKNGIASKVMTSRNFFAVAGKSIKYYLKLYGLLVGMNSGRAFADRILSSDRARSIVGPGTHGIAAKILCTETAFKVASEAISIFGGNGLSREYLIEKMFRDARASMVEDGVNEALALAGSEDL